MVGEEYSFPELILHLSGRALYAGYLNISAILVKMKKTYPIVSEVRMHLHLLTSVEIEGTNFFVFLTYIQRIIFDVYD
jgi:hypothetical protein